MIYVEESAKITVKNGKSKSTKIIQFVCWLFVGIFTLLCAFAKGHVTTAQYIVTWIALLFYVATMEVEE